MIQSILLLLLLLSDDTVNLVVAAFCCRSISLPTIDLSLLSIDLSAVVDVAAAAAVDRSLYC
jgi:hypothetical protein